MSRSRSLVRVLAMLVVTPVAFVGLVSVNAPAAVANQPTSLSPAEGSTVAGLPVFSWDRVPGAARYDVQIATNASFSNIVVAESTVNHQYVVRTQLPNGDLWWRVRVSGSNPWTAAGFRRSPGAAPTQTGPADGAVLPQPQSPPKLSWNPVAGATAYELEYGTDPNFTDTAQKTSRFTRGTTFVVPLQQPNTYYWHVRAEAGPGNYTDWSAVRSYVDPGLAAPLRVSPVPDPANPNVAPVVQDAVLSWTPVPGAASYDLQVSTDRNFLTVVEDRRGIRGTTYARPGTLNNDQYFWRVRAVDAAGYRPAWPSTSDAWSFRRNWPDQPELEYPLDESTVGDPFYFQWTGTQLASTYVVELSTNDSFTPESSVIRCRTVKTTFTPAANGDCWPGAAGTYFWRVKAIDDYSSPAPVSDLISAEVFSFTYDPELVSLQSPSQGESVTVPTLSWAASAGASYYDVTVTNIATSAVTSGRTAGVSWTPWHILEPGTYRWSVRAVSEDGRAGSSVLPAWQRTFTVVSSPPATATTPAPTSPNAVHRHQPTLTWTPVTNATGYRLYMRRGSSGGWQEVGNFPYPAGEDTGTSRLASGNYQWFVEAYSGGTVIASGAIGTFTLAPPAVVTGYRAAITGNHLTGAAGTPVVDCDATLPASCQNLRQTPVLSWDAHPDTAYYRLWVSYDAELTNLVPRLGGIRVYSTMWSDTVALPDSQAGTAYFWTVQPCRASDACAPLQHAEHSFNKLSNAVKPLAPLEGDVVSNAVQFRWEDYLQTVSTADNSDSNPSTPATTEALYYRVEVATDPQFDAVIDRLEVDQRSVVSPHTTYPEGPLWWRVQAVDGSGNPLTWSDPVAFTKRSPVPVLTSPVDDAVVAGDQALEWQGADFGVTYDVEIYRNGDTGANPVNRVRVDYNDPRQTFALDAPLPASGNPYVWRVRRNDVSGRNGDWNTAASPTAWGRFRVRDVVPTLVAPVGGARVEPSDGLFTWLPQNAASSYRVEWRLAGSGSAPYYATTHATAWAPVDTLGGGDWEWRVTAVDITGVDMGTSAWTRFLVVDTPTAQPGVSISGNGQVGTLLTATAPVWDMPDVATTYQWYRGDWPVPGATATTYTVVGDDVDRPLTVRATGARDGYKNGVSTSNVIHGSLGAVVQPTEVPTITGVAAARETLTAQPGTWPGSPTYAYQWFVDGQAVARETGQAYVVRTRDAGLPVSVRVTATTAGYAPGSAMSAPRAVSKLSSKTTATAQVKKITTRDRGVLDVYVEMFDYATTLGAVKVTDAGKVIATTALKANGDGRLVIRLKKLKVGKHKLVVSYTGSSATAPSQAKPLVIKVVKVRR
ncbi:hypothetical protein [Nocardioides sp.]|uniref:hypothetical protein n=1 Tax=Nocardioides sp. TaxID=35761 RepID=UPI001A232C9F|nr:hypothetical protein [Nocardioides sp.]MBJ7356355.1 Ig-like domain repeat protein [Nocardioides sp.]